MPRYFLHVQNQTAFAKDEEGTEAPTIDAIRNEAARAAGAILTSDLVEGKQDVEFTIMVEDETGARVLTVPVEAKMKTGSA